MSDAIGPLAVIPTDGRGPLLPGSSEVSAHTQQLIDEEVRRIVDEAHEQVVALLTENRARLDSLVQALLEHETLDEEEAYTAAGVSRTPAGAEREPAIAARGATRLD
jgi:cell division protease FtsH